MHYRREVDGLRAIAVLPVVLFHAAVPGFRGGFVGVDIFFVISGFLITGILVKESDVGSFSLRRFYERRARRIMPALTVVLAASLPPAWFWLSPQDFKDFSRSLASVGVFVANLHFWRSSGYFDTAAELKPLLHTWSLAVEEQYYVIFPVAVVWLARGGRRRLHIALLVALTTSLGLALWATGHRPNAAFFLLPTRAWELMIGALASTSLAHAPATERRAWRRETASGLGLAGVVFSVVLFDHHTPMPGAWALLPTLSTAAILVAANETTVVGRLLAAPTLVHVGLWSYSIYLWHQPLLSFLRHATLHEPGLASRLTVAAIAVLLGALSYRFVETPFRDKQRTAPSAIWAVSAATIVCAVVLGVVGYATGGFPSRESERARVASDVTMAAFEDSVRGCWDKIAGAPTVDSACRLGKPDLPPSFVLIGDSHAGTLLAPLDEIATARGIAGLSLSFRSCPPIFDARVEPVQEGDLACAELRESIRQNIEKLPETVVLAARWTLFLEAERFNNQEGGREPGMPWAWSATTRTPESREQRLIDSALEFVRRGKRVVLVYPMPEAGWSVPMFVAKSARLGLAPAPSIGSTALSVFSERNGAATAALNRLGESPFVARVYPAARFCDLDLRGRCITQKDGIPLYFDNNHLRPEPLRPIATEILDLAQAAMPPRRLPQPVSK